MAQTYCQHCGRAVELPDDRPAGSGLTCPHCQLDLSPAKPSSAPAAPSSVSIKPKGVRSVRPSGGAASRVRPGPVRPSSVPVPPEPADAPGPPLAAPVQTQPAQTDEDFSWATADEAGALRSTARAAGHRRQPMIRSRTGGSVAAIIGIVLVVGALIVIGVLVAGQYHRIRSGELASVEQMRSLQPPPRRVTIIDQRTQKTDPRTGQPIGAATQPADEPTDLEQTPQPSPDQPQPLAAGPTLRRANPDVDIRVLSKEKKPLAPGYENGGRVVGQLDNQTGQCLRAAQVVAVLYNRSGAQIGRAEGQIVWSPPGDRPRFEATWMTTAYDSVAAIEVDPTGHVTYADGWHGLRPTGHLSWSIEPNKLAGSVGGAFVNSTGKTLEDIKVIVVLRNSYGGREHAPIITTLDGGDSLAPGATGTFTAAWDQVFGSSIARPLCEIRAVGRAQ